MYYLFPNASTNKYSIVRRGNHGTEPYWVTHPDHTDEYELDEALSIIKSL